MADTPETQMVHIGGNQWMSKAEARAKGYMAIPVETPPIKIKRDWLDIIVDLACIITIALIGHWLNDTVYFLMWGH
jgi:hypothetical protein